MIVFLRQALNDAIFSYNQYRGASSTFALLIIAVIVLFYYNKKYKDISGDAYTIYFVLLSFLMIFNPFVAGSIIYVIKDYVYWRSFWIIPITPVIAFAMAYFVYQVPSRKRIAAIAGMILVILLSGSLIYNRANYQKAANWYKLPMQTIEICQLIKQDTSDTARVAVPVSLVSYIRQYDASILMPYGRRTHGRHVDFSIQLDSATPDFLFMADYINRNKVNYIVLRDHGDSSVPIPEWCLEIGTSEGYRLYRIALPILE